jgi:polyhydroxybutyrate depolymerase
LAFSLWAAALLPGLVLPVGNASAAGLDGERTSLRERIQARRDARADAAPASGAISAPGDHSFTLHHQGQKRRYRVHVPASYRPGAAPSPLVMAFHGGGGNMNIQADDRYYGLISQSERSHTIVAFANGYSRLPSGKLATWNAGFCCGKASEKDIDDVGFVRAVLADLKQRLNIDPHRIFATGMSNGGMLSYRLACEMADTFKAIAAVAGTDVTGARCHPARPISVLHIHARDDDHVLFNGGHGSASQTKTDFTPVPDTIRKWVALNACQPTPQTVLSVPGARCEAYSGCRDGAAVKLCTTDTGGHAWPGGIKPRGGEPGSSALSANDVIWSFFGLR